MNEQKETQSTVTSDDLGKRHPFPITSIKEVQRVSGAEAANQFLCKGWLLLHCYDQKGASQFILGRI
ncbi:MAG: hypothetical protein P4N41_06435 [Negativicutes bacterium]|nr:hypothetical protein [Negativicutes bacterium]